MKYLIGAALAMLLQAILLATTDEFYFHLAPGDNIVQFNGTVIELTGLNGK